MTPGGHFMHLTKVLFHLLIESPPAEIVEEMSPAEEKKIALDLQEKETCDEKEKQTEEEEEVEDEDKIKSPVKEPSEVGVEEMEGDKDKSNKEDPCDEKLVSNKESDNVDEQIDVLQTKAPEDVIQSPESEGAQEQRDLSELIVSAQQKEIKQEEEVEETSAEQDTTIEFKNHVDKLKGVLESIISYYEDELTSSKSLPSNESNLQNEIETRLEQSVDLLSTLDCNADPSDEAELLKVKKACILTTELVRKCMKLAIELIEAEAKDANNFMAYMHSEPDLILHCQEIENYCNDLLPTEKEGAEVADDFHKETDSKADDEKDHCSDAVLSDKECEKEMETGKDMDVAVVPSDNAEKDTGLLNFYHLSFFKYSHGRSLSYAY